jgi:hypothetical protein
MTCLTELDLDIESLEPRQMLAGTVNVIVSGADLRIIGDSQANSIEISGFGVSGLDGTTINQTASYLNADFSKIKNFKIELLDGNDSVEVRNIFLEDKKGVLDIDGGAQRNTIKIEQAGFKHIRIANGNTSSGLHRVDIINSQVGDDANGTLTVRNGNGGSRTTLSNTSGRSVHGNVSITNGDGENWVNLTSRIRNGIIKIKNGTGRGRVEIDNVDRVKNIILENGTPGEASFGELRLLNSDIEFGSVTVNNHGYGNVYFADTTIKKNVKLTNELQNRPVGAGSFGYGVDFVDAEVGGTITFSNSDEAELSNNQDRSTRIEFRTTQVEKATKLTMADRDNATLKISSSTLGALSYNGGRLEDTITIKDSNLGTTHINTSRGVSETTIEETDFTGHLTLENADRASLSDLFLPDTGYESSFDTLTIDDITVAKKLQVIHGSGGSTTTLSGAVVGLFQFRSNQGQDILKIDDSAFNKNVDIRTGTSVKKEIAAVAGLDEDQILIETDPTQTLRTDFRGKANFRTYGGNDVISLGAAGTATKVLFASFVKVEAGDIDNAGLPGNSFEFDILILDDPISKLRTSGVEQEQTI